MWTCDMASSWMSSSVIQNLLLNSFTIAKRTWQCGAETHKAKPNPSIMVFISGQKLAIGREKEKHAAKGIRSLFSLSFIIENNVYNFMLLLICIFSWPDQTLIIKYATKRKLTNKWCSERGSGKWWEREPFVRRAQKLSRNHFVIATKSPCFRFTHFECWLLI